MVSAPLADRFKSFKDKHHVKILDGEQIERELLLFERNWGILKRFFPISSKKWLDEHQKPAILLDEYEPLVCEICGKDLLTQNGERNPSGIVAFVYPMQPSASGKYDDVIHHVYAACKGDCDKRLENRHYASGLTTGWKDISDLSIPSCYLQWVMAILNNLKDGDQYLNDSFSNLKRIIIRLGQNTFRDCTEKERNRFKTLQGLPNM